MLLNRAYIMRLQQQLVQPCPPELEAAEFGRDYRDTINLSVAMVDAYRDFNKEGNKNKGDGELISEIEDTLKVQVDLHCNVLPPCDRSRYAKYPKDRI